MPINDLECIQLINKAYYGGGSWDQKLEINFVRVFVKEYPDFRIIVFPGSESVLDWCRDFQADMRDDPDLGGIEWGFQQGIRDVYNQLIIGSDKKCIITGHSLGAARALIFTALLSNHDNLEVVTFGSPRPGGGKLRKILSGVTQRSYRNCRDPVCQVPFYIPWFRPYQHPSDLIPVSAPPPADDKWGKFAAHHSRLYEQALLKLFSERPV